MSKIFEMLQQAQRDQELLRQSAPPAAIHSRSLDILRLAGKEEQLFDLPIVPETSETEPAPPPGGFSRGETYKLVQHLFMAANSVSPRTVMFCGVEEGGGDWICAETAELLGTVKPGTICVVDANVNSPSLHTYFGVANSRGLSAALVEAGPVMEFTQQVGHGRVRLMNAGEPSMGLNSGPVLASARLAPRVRELRGNFDYVLVNAPPATRDSATGYLGSLADGVVLIVEPSFTSRQAAREIKEEIEAAGGRVLGVILHRRALSLSDRSNSQSQKPADGQAH